MPTPCEHDPVTIYMGTSAFGAGEAIARVCSRCGRCFDSPDV